MKKIIPPVVALAVIVSALGVVYMTGRERRAALAENASMAERLSRAEAVSQAVMKIDAMYHAQKDENAVLLERLAIAESASRSCRPDMKDAVADRPHKKAEPVLPPLALPGYTNK